MKGTPPSGQKRGGARDNYRQTPMAAAERRMRPRTMTGRAASVVKVGGFSVGNPDVNVALMN